MHLRKTVCVALLCLTGLLAALSSATAAGQRVFDQADLFSASEEEELSVAIARFQEETGMDFVILTTHEAHGDQSPADVADDFYDYGGFGFDEEYSGVLYFIDTNERYHHLSTTGVMIDRMTDERINSAIDACTPSLSAGQYYAAVETMLSHVDDCFKAGIPEGQFRYDVETGEPLTPSHPSLAQSNILISVMIAILICFLL